MRKMIQKRVGIILLVVLGCCSLMAAIAVAEGLDATCRRVQKEVQASVGDESGYRNHGAWVSAAAKIVSAHVTAGDIDSVCASCIMNQFARSIPIAEQTPCGPDAPNPECTGATCGNFLPCNTPNSCTVPICVTTDDGLGACVEGATPCSGLQLCPNGKGDCPPGYICALQTCCGDPVCVPPSSFCTSGTAPASAAVPVTQGATLASPNR